MTGEWICVGGGACHSHTHTDLSAPRLTQYSSGCACDGSSGGGGSNDDNDGNDDNDDYTAGDDDDMVNTAYECYTLVGQDSYGDGWNGAYFTWATSAGELWSSQQPPRHAALRATPSTS